MDKIILILIKFYKKKKLIGNFKEKNYLWIKLKKLNQNQKKIKKS